MKKKPYMKPTMDVAMFRPCSAVLLTASLKDVVATDGNDDLELEYSDQPASTNNGSMWDNAW